MNSLGAHQFFLAHCLHETGNDDEARGIAAGALREHASAPTYVRRNHASAASKMKKLQRQLG